MIDKYQHFTLESLTPKLGAEVHGVDLARVSADLFAELADAFDRHLVLVFRDQELTRAEHKRFARLFGPLQLHPAKTRLGMPGDPEIFDIKINADTQVANGEDWHTDLSCEPVPPKASALYITQVPPSGGGDTLFANMQEAYATLSRPVRDMLLKLTAYHSGYKDLRAYGVVPSLEQIYPCANHPVVIAHPESGKPVLFVNEPFTEKINELTAKESAAMLEMLYRHIQINTRLHCRVRWARNTLVLWDNRAVHHHAIWDYYPESRQGERVTIQNDAPPKAFINNHGDGELWRR